MWRTLVLAALVAGVVFGCGGNVETSTGAACAPLPCPNSGWDPVACKCKSPADAGLGGSGGSGAGGAGGAAAGGAGGTAGAAGSPSWGSCNEPYECRLVSLDCCNMECFATDLSAFAAVNSNYAQKYLEALCTPPPPCPGYMCPEQEHKEWLRTASQLGVTCEAGACKGFDIRTSPLSSCTSDSDCRLQWGLGCCELCSPSPENLVAVAKNGDLFGYVCGNVDVDCCVPPPVPSDAVAMCDPTGHCAVAWAL